LEPVNADAATEYMLVFTDFNPYYTQTVAGPFGTYQECLSVESQNSYVPGGAYSCRSIYVPG
jgi:hypothetical protein